jgi:putative addiction module killer protein
MATELRYYQTVAGEQGYRVYFARRGQVVVLLLCGGDKRTQQKDIDRAKAYFDDYKARTARKRPRGRR